MIFNCNSTHPHPIVWGGVGWGGIITSLAFPHDLDATLYDLHWHFHMILMLRSMIFNCNSTHPHPIVWGGVGCGGIITSLAFPHDLDATLYDLHWHFHMILMLRSMIFIGISTWTWCYALWSSIAIPHDLDATLYDLQLQFHMILILDATFYDLQLAFPHDLDATLYDLHWHFHMILMLRSMIFTGISTWTWCYSLWSSIAIPRTWCYALWSSMWEKVAVALFEAEVMEGLSLPSRRTFFLDRFWMQKLAPRCEDVVILIIFARR